ncbi:MAG: exonuclease SbcCD subunit D [Lachnospiraceae bacterium]
MKFFHLSDLHIGKQLHHYNLKEDQIVILKEIVELARDFHPDAIMISGDIYDKSVPSAEAVTIFDDFLTQLSEIRPQIPVLIISGNHDSAQRLQYASGILKKHHIYLAGNAPHTSDEHIEKVVLHDEYGEIDVYMLPYFKPSYVRGVFDDDLPDSYTDVMIKLIEREEIDFENRRNILMSHQFYTGKKEPETCDSETVCVGGIDNINASCVEQFDYVALGHLHGKQWIGKEHIRYCGTLLKYSVSEVNQKKCLTMVSLREKGQKPEITEILLHPLRDVRQKKGKLEDILSNAQNEEKEDYISVILTDETEPYHPKEQLQEIYSRILEIKIDNTRTRNKLSECDEVKIETKNPLEVFCDFYHDMQGKNMSEEEMQMVSKVFEEVEEE